MNHQKLQGQSALITGGGSGIGLACAQAFLRDGADVMLFGRDGAKLERAAATLRSGHDHGALCKVLTFSGDVAKETDVQNAVQRLFNETGRLNIAVANAGTGTLGPLVAVTDEQWRRVMETNLNGTFYTLKHAGAAIARCGGGAMCSISSIAGVRTHRFMGPYCASKAAIDMLVRNTADELGASKVRVNSVCPGLVETDLSGGLRSTGAVLQDYLECMPIRRVGDVDDIANAVRFLCGPESSWVTGVVLSVDGGHHLRRGPDITPIAAQFFNESILRGVMPADPSAQ